MNIADKVTVTKYIKGKGHDTNGIVHKKGRIYALTDKIITIQYLKNGKQTYRESFNIADIIERKAVIEVLVNGEWVQVTKEYFK